MRITFAVKDGNFRPISLYLGRQDFRSFFHLASAFAHVFVITQKTRPNIINCFISLAMENMAYKNSNTRIATYSQIPRGSSRLSTTHSMCQAHAFWLRQACRTAGSTQSTERVRIAQHDVRDRRDSQLSLLCNLYKVTICKLFTNLLEYTHLFQFILFDRTNRICVRKSKNDDLYRQAL